MEDLPLTDGVRELESRRTEKGGGDEEKGKQEKREKEKRKKERVWLRVTQTKIDRDGET